MQNMSCLPQKCIWNIKKKKKYPLISMVRFIAHICRSCGQLRSVPYSRFTEHLALCATGCKTKLDKCSPRKVDHCCPGLGIQIILNDGYAPYPNMFFCWSEKLKLWIMIRIQFLEFSGPSSKLSTCHWNYNEKCWFLLSLHSTRKQKWKMTHAWI